METRSIKSQSDLEDFLDKIDWGDAFIREVYIVSPTYVTTVGSTVGSVAADAAVGMKILITNPDPSLPGVELVFDGVEQVVLWFGTDLAPTGSIKRDEVELRLSNGSLPIRAKALRYRFLDEKCWGWDVRYGKESFFDEQGFSV